MNDNQNISLYESTIKLDNHISFLTFLYSYSILILNSAFRLLICFWYLNTFSRNWSLSYCTLFSYFFTFSMSSSSPDRYCFNSFVKCSFKSLATYNSYFTISNWFLSDSLILLYFKYFDRNPQLQSVFGSNLLMDPFLDLFKVPRIDPKLRSLRLTSFLLSPLLDLFVIDLSLKLNFFWL